MSDLGQGTKGEFDSQRPLQLRVYFWSKTNQNFSVRHSPRTPSPIMVFASLFMLVLASYVYRDAVFALATTLVTSTDSTASQHIVDTGYARYLGNHSYPNTIAYLGIPYAEPPLGERRFRAPLPLNTARVAAEAKGGIIDATEYPDFCVQGTTGGGDAGGAGSEDCLNVNIYAPVNATKHSNLYFLSCLYRIQSSGYAFGNPASWPFDHWVNQSPNVVVASVYYRLDSLGFLASPALHNNPALGDLNVGFLDQIQALKWVQANIGSFGGDKSKVTINGHSAGGGSIELHLVANEGEKLFSQAIAQSVYRGPLPSPEQQEPLFNFYANHAGCGQGTDAQKIACLRKASVSALAMAQDAASTSAFTASPYRSFRPVIDGKVLTDYPTKSIQAGKFAKVPLIVGATSNETLSGGSSITQALQNSFPLLTNASANALIAKYPLAEFGSADLQFQTVTGDASVRCARSILGTAFAATTKAWTYRVNQKTPGTVAVIHAAENWFMFRGTAPGFNGTIAFQPLTPADTVFAAELIAYWVSFVRSGDPNTFKLATSPSWTPFTAVKSERIVLQEPSGSSGVATSAVSGSFLEVEGDEEKERCALVADLVEQLQN
ncbi:alpha/beta-hydrolase [Pholiota conissans]|uniref:Carboxylic ester hydrolase n=1 Tax=Pholiota conissans TaxID=109636 RepID=A0A9P5Z7U3_9AGAR|nr:alpha/beta-hydrolase [Pholiota conissans]